MVDAPGLDYPLTFSVHLSRHAKSAFEDRMAEWCLNSMPPLGKVDRLCVMEEHGRLYPHGGAEATLQPANG